jgi:hypothetical protein
MFKISDFSDQYLRWTGDLVSVVPITRTNFAQFIVTAAEIPRMATV